MINVVYLFLLLVGAFGFVAMTFLGLGHGIGGHHSGSLGHAKVSLPAHGPGSHAVTPHSSAHGARTGLAKPTLNKPHSSGVRVASDPWQLLMAVSPIDVFSVLFGAGATGILLKTFLAGAVLAAVAAVGGVVFALAVIRPYMGLMMRFASKPSEGLEGQVASLGEAITNFDREGRGMVRLTLDEQVIQLLSYLDKGELESGVQVVRGDSLVVISVDAKRNTCTVSKEFAPSSSDEGKMEKSQASAKSQK